MTSQGFSRWFEECLAGPTISDAYFDGITILADPIITGRHDQVLPILPEEQVFTSRMLRRLLEEESKGRDSPLKVLDIGTGSGIFAIEAAKRGHSVTAIDISNRAIRFAHLNAAKNKVAICPQERSPRGGEIKFLEMDAREFKQKEFDIVILNPPFNPTTPGFNTSLHSQGGMLGQSEFEWQFRDAREVWLKEGGVCAGVHMIHHKEADPAEAFGEHSVNVRVHPIIEESISCLRFVRGQYQEMAGGCSDDPVTIAVTDYLLTVEREHADGMFSLIYFEFCGKERTKAADRFSSAPQQSRDCWKERIHLHKLISYSSSRLRRSPSIEIDLDSLPSSGCRLDRRDLESLLKSWWEYASCGRNKPALLLTDVTPRHDVLASMGKICQTTGVAYQGEPVPGSPSKAEEIAGVYTKLVRKLQLHRRGSYLHPFFIKNDSQRSKRVAYLTVRGPFDPAAGSEARPGDCMAEEHLSIASIVTPLETLNVKTAMELEKVVRKRAAKDDLHLSGDFEDVHKRFHADLDDRAKTFEDPEDITPKTSFLLACPLRTFNFAGSTDKAAASDESIHSYQGGAWIYCRFSSAWSPSQEALVIDLARILTACSSAENSLEAKKVVLASLEKSARAGVFARNFSHITGSHVVSNPEFRKALFGRAIKSAAANVEAMQERFEAIREKRWRGDPATSWGDAHKALDDGLAILKDAQHQVDENTRHFHDYLQGRFDFIARAIDRTHDQPEPIFFVEDLLEGYLSQTAFLDTFVADLGLRLTSMKFELQLPGHDELPICFETGWEKSPVYGLPSRLKWTPGPGHPSHSSPADYPVLIGLPGGMVGVHAFYSLLENIIRNSAKYGALRKLDQKIGEPKEYRMILRLTESKKDPQDYDLEIEDNFSTEIRDGNRKSLTKTLARLLESSFVDKEGRPRREGQGILEMQACSVELRSKNPECRNLRIVTTRDDGTPIEHGAPLKFLLNLERPILLGIAGYNANVAQPQDRKLTKFFPEPPKTLETGTHILVLNGENRKALKVWLDWMAEAPGENQSTLQYGETEPIPRTHALMPNRIMVVCSASATKDISCLLGKLPKRRVMITQDANLYRSIFGGEALGASREDMTQEQTLILKVYEAWLIAWKRGPEAPAVSEPWDLWIGFGREGNLLKERWASPLAAFQSDLIHVRVKSSHCSPLESRGSEGNALPLLDADTLVQRAYQRRALVFDNHGESFKEFKDSQGELDFRKSARFYQTFSGSHTPDLFRLLFHPPSHPFAFSFLMHALVESCLTTVAVVDERLAADLLFATQDNGEEGNDFFPRLAAHQKAGVFPVFTFKERKSSRDDAGQNQKESFGFYTPEHHRVMAKIIPWSADGKNPNLENEGVKYKVLEEGTGTLLSYLVPQPPDSNSVACSLLSSRENPCDVLIVHEGALDILAKQAGMNWKSDFASKLYEISPLVVRTSGRGRQTSHLLPTMPFVEFSEVSSSLLTSRNKYSLVRALLGTVGNPPIVG